MLTRILAATGATALATGLIMAFSAAPSSGSGVSGQGSSLVPSPANRSALIASTGRGITARVQPGVAIICTRLRYDSEVAAGTGMVINPDGLVLTNNHVIEDATSITATVAGKAYPALRPGNMVSVTWTNPAGQQAASRIRLAAGPPQ